MKRLVLIILIIVIIGVIAAAYIRKNEDLPITMPGYSDEVTEVDTVSGGTKITTEPRVDSGIKTPPEKYLYSFDSGDYKFSFSHQSHNRIYLVHVPPSYEPSSPMPAVLVLHGGGGKAEGLDELSDFNKKADEEGFIVVYPEGTAQGRLKNAHTWNAGDCAGIPKTSCANQATDAGVDDVGYIHRVLDDLESKFNVNTRRIYATGFSNGGQMVQRLGCEMSERLAAIAPVSGTLLQNPCTPARKIPVLNIFARNDESVPYDGGRGQCTTENFSWPDVTYTMGIWKKNLGVSNSPVSVYENKTAHCEAFRGRGTEVQLCTIESDENDSRIGGHSWPGASEYPVRLCAAMIILKCPCIPTSDLDATDYIWDFFKKYSL